MNQDQAFVYFNVPKQDVLNKSFVFARDFVSMMEQRGKEGFQSSSITFDGYNHVSEEIFEIPEIRNWADQFVKLYPHIFYYLNQNVDGCIASILACIGDVSAVKAQQYSSMTPNDFVSQGYKYDELPQINLTLSVEDFKINKIKKGILKHCTYEIGDKEGAAKTIELLDNLLPVRG